MLGQIISQYFTPETLLSHCENVELITSTTLYDDFLQAEPGSAEAGNKASTLTDCLYRESWEETVKDIDFTQSSQLAWKTFSCLMGGA